MNDLLRGKVQPYIDDITSRATELFDTVIENTDREAVGHTKIPKDQPLSDPLIRARISKLIKGEYVVRPTSREREIAGGQLDKAIKARESE